MPGAAWGAGAADASPMTKSRMAALSFMVPESGSSKAGVDCWLKRMEPVSKFKFKCERLINIRSIVIDAGCLHACQLSIMFGVSLLS